jgi:hypothetical protein
MSDGKISGKVHFIDDTKTYGQRGFRKRVVVLEQDKGRFTNYVPLEFVQDACETVDQLQVGDEVQVEYRLSGRKWQRDASSEVKYFLSVEALNFNKLGTSGGPAVDSGEANDQFAEAEQDDDDVPF